MIRIFGTRCYIVGWIWGHHVPSKLRESLIPRHGVTCQKTWILSTTAVSTFNLAVGTNHPPLWTEQPSPSERRHPDWWLSLACCHEDHNLVDWIIASVQQHVVISRELGSDGQKTAGGVTCQSAQLLLLCCQLNPEDVRQNWVEAAQLLRLWLWKRISTFDVIRRQPHKSEKFWVSWWF